MNRLFLVVLVVVGACHRSEGPHARVAPASPSAPRSLVAEGYDAHVSLTEGPGFLVDGTAPPPPPGHPIATNPYFHGSCDGDALGCSRAGVVVRASSSLDEVARALAEAGFRVTMR